MEVIAQALSDVFNTVWKYALTIKITDILDMAIIAFLAYRVIKWIRRTSSAQVAKALVLMLGVLWLSTLFNLNVVSFLLSRAVEMGLLALVILFQPELRRLLEQVGRSNFGNFFGISSHVESAGMDAVIVHTVRACMDLSKERQGALIIFERKIHLENAVKTGTVLDAAVSGELLKNIFYPKSPLHDGAAIIRDCRIMGAGCMLPLSGNIHLSRDLGMRHRAGIGVSENSDAVAVVVSEETGSISVAVGGVLKRHLSPETLERLLINELVPKDQEGKRDRTKNKMQNLLRRKKTNGADEESDSEKKK